MFCGPGVSLLTIMENRLFDDKSSEGFESTGHTKAKPSK
jgi:hypothetical protein